MPEIRTPIGIFTDINGKPLDDGYIYIGVSGLDAELNPINVYWDAGFTVSATQPIRTNAGYPDNSGSNGSIYVKESDFSVLVKNKRGSIVPSSVNSNGTLDDIENLGYSNDLQSDVDTEPARAIFNPNRQIYRERTNYYLPEIGLKSWKYTYGIGDTAATFSLASSLSTEHNTQVSFVSSDEKISNTVFRDHVGIFGQTDGLAPLVTTSNTTFTATTVQSADFATEIASGLIRTGMLIDTNESPKKTGFIRGIDSGTNTLTVSGWYIVDGSEMTATPSNGTEVFVNPSTGIWGMNWNVGITSSSQANTAYGIEIGTFNTKDDSVNMNGVLVTQLGTNKSNNGFWSLGKSGANYVNGFASQFADNGYYCDSITTVGYWANAVPEGFRARNVSGYAFIVRDSGSTFVTGIHGDGTRNRRLSKVEEVLTDATITDFAVIVTNEVIASPAAFNLPAPGGKNTNREIYLKNPFSSTATAFYGGTVESGTGSIQVRPGECVLVYSDGTTWIPISERKIIKEITLTTETLIANQTISDDVMLAYAPTIGAPTTFNLPSPASNNRRVIMFKNPFASTANAILAGTTETGGNFTIAPGECIRVVSDGSIWAGIGEYIP